MLLFEDNPLSKIGVRFDKPIHDGVDLGDVCEGGHGYFCNGMLNWVINIVMCIDLINGSIFSSFFNS